MNALIIVDLQNDFCEAGALQVPNADVIVPIINEQIPKFDLVVATMEWHPERHMLFASSWPFRKPFEVAWVHGRQQTLWPDHCVEFTHGAMFHPGLDTSTIDRIFPKGEDRRIHNYSAFFGDHLPYDRQTVLPISDYLRNKGVDQVTVCGLARDYCVKYTALDAVSLGFKVTLLTAATAAVNLDPNDGAKAVLEMERAGVLIA